MKTLSFCLVILSFASFAYEVIDVDNAAIPPYPPNPPDLLGRYMDAEEAYWADDRTSHVVYTREHGNVQEIWYATYATNHWEKEEVASVSYPYEINSRIEIGASLYDDELHLIVAYDMVNTQTDIYYIMRTEKVGDYWGTPSAVVTVDSEEFDNDTILTGATYLDGYAWVMSYWKSTGRTYISHDSSKGWGTEIDDSWHKGYDLAKIEYGDVEYARRTSPFNYTLLVQQHHGNDDVDWNFFYTLDTFPTSGYFSTHTFCNVPETGSEKVNLVAAYCGQPSVFGIPITIYWNSHDWVEGGTWPTSVDMVEDQVYLEFDGALSDNQRLVSGAYSDDDQYVAITATFDDTKSVYAFEKDDGDWSDPVQIYDGDFSVGDVITCIEGHDRKPLCFFSLVSEETTILAVEDLSTLDY